MIKRILSFLLVLVMAFSLLPANVLAAEIDEDEPSSAGDGVPAPASPERGGVSEADEGVTPDNAPAPAGDEAEPASPERGGVSEADEGVTPADANDPVGDRKSVV